MQEKGRDTMNPKNRLALIKVLLIPVFLIFIAVDQIPFGRIIALLIFVIAVIIGYIVQSKKGETNFSKIVDPLSDTLLIATALIALVELRVIPDWIVVVIIGTEFAVTGLKSIAVSDGIVIAEGKLDKVKNIFQIITTTFALLYVNFKKNYELRNVLEQMNFFRVHAAGIVKFLKYSTNITLGIAFIVTLISCTEYFRSNKAVFMNDK